MEHFITLLCIYLFLLVLTPFAHSLHAHTQVDDHRAHDLNSPTSLPRKLKVIHEESKMQRSMESAAKAIGTIINTGENKEREWEEEEISPSELMTMDYSKVQRRQPIHNKSLPVAP